VFHWSEKLSDLKQASKDAMFLWRNNGCPIDGPFKEALTITRREYKKAIKSAKFNKKKEKADKLQQSLLNCDAKKFWNLIKKDCEPKISVVNSIYVYSFVDLFKGSFDNSINNDVAVTKFYSAFKASESTDSLVFQIDEVEKAVSALSNSSTLDNDG
jgi:hypothetical protein